MKGLLFLGLVGAAIYGALVLSYDVLSHDTAKDAFVRQSLGSPGDRQLRSWGTDLPALTGSNASRDASNFHSQLARRGKTNFRTIRREYIPAS